MAKPQVTEDDLKAGVGGLGGFGSLTGQPSRRDSPFGSDHSKRGSPAATQVIELPPVTAVLPVREGPVAPDPAPTPSTQQASLTSHDVPQKKEEPRAASPRKLKVEETVPEATTEPDATSVRKEDPYSERVTLPISPDMRDGLHLLASKLQRRKTDKSERITSNTLMRVAVRLLLEDLRPSESDAPNTEEELYSLVQAKLKRS